jgi:hypothetical protein
MGAELNASLLFEAESRLSRPSIVGLLDVLLIDAAQTGNALQDSPVVIMCVGFDCPAQTR